MSVPSRLAVRIVLLDADSRVLLFEGRDLSDAGDTIRWWFTAGGGVDEGESLLDAAVRELREETGQTEVELVGPFHVRECEFLNHGEPLHQVEHYFAARSADTDLRVDGWTELEQRAVTTWRWWTLDELAAEGVQYFPEELGDLVEHADGVV